VHPAAGVFQPISLNSRLAKPSLCSATPGGSRGNAMPPTTRDVASPQIVDQGLANRV
jgi:hypothetical protein